MSAFVPNDIVFSDQAWKSLRPLLLSSGFAVAETRRLENTVSPQVLVDALRITSDPPRGEEFPPLADWMVWVVRPHPPQSAGEWIKQIQPRASQSLVLGQFSTMQPESWDAVHFRDGVITPLDSFRVVGPGMLKVCRESSDVADGESLDRDSRTRGALGDEVYKKVRRSTVTLVGAGRTGSQFAWQLAALGVKHLRLIDPDHLEEHNLNAMPGLAASDVGSAKIEVLAERLTAFRPDILVTALKTSATDATAVQLMRQPAELLVTCCDNDTPRLAAALIARETLKPHLDVGTHVARDGQTWRLSGDIRFVLPGEGCVVNCVGGLGDREQAFYELAAPPNSLPRGPIVSLGCAKSREPDATECDRGGNRHRDLVPIPGRSTRQLLAAVALGNLEKGLAANAAPVSSRSDCWLCG